MSKQENYLATKDIKEAIHYWQTCLTYLESGESHEKVAYRIVDIVCNDNCDTWIKADKDFGQVFELASMLELPGDIYIPQEERPEAWEELKRRMKTLEERYLKE